MSYTRVLPRDLFNESKLLKCLGQLVLILHDGVDRRRRAAPAITFEMVNEDLGFDIQQDESTGDLSCDNLLFQFRGEELQFHSAYNSKELYPLYCEIDGTEYPVFNDDGSFTAQFLEALESAL